MSFTISGVRVIIFSVCSEEKQRLINKFTQIFPLNLETSEKAMLKIMARLKRCLNHG